VALPDEVSTCAHVVAAGGPLLVPDCRTDERFATNPFVQAGLLGFYAGAPLVGPTGLVLGAVCVMDPNPRAATDPALLEALADLARQGSVLLQRRRQRVEQHAHRDVLEAVAAGEDLPDVLDRLARHVERLVSPGLLCSVLLLDDDGVTLHDGA
jgi:GAF domain-containing protein